LCDADPPFFSRMIRPAIFPPFPVGPPQLPEEILPPASPPLLGAQHEARFFFFSFPSGQYGQRSFFLCSPPLLLETLRTSNFVFFFVNFREFNMWQCPALSFSAALPNRVFKPLFFSCVFEDSPFTGIPVPPPPLRDPPCLKWTIYLFSFSLGHPLLA